MQALRFHSAVQWWLALLVLLALLMVPVPRQPLAVLQQPPGSMIFFVAGLLTLFASRRPFHAFKHAVIAFHATERQQATQLWAAYFRIRRIALLIALLPALAALAGRILGLEEVPVLLLGVSSMLVLWLYRTPAQLW